MTSSPTLLKKSLFGYGVLAMPLAFAGMPLYIHAPDFYATHVGLSLSTLALLLLILRVIDAVQDPLIGRLSDRFYNLRFRIMMGAAILLVASFFALFQPVIHPVFWFLCFMFLATTAFSALSINLNTLGGLWSSDRHQQSRITGVREACGLVGLLLAVVLPAYLMQLMPALSAFAVVSIILATLMLIAVALFSFWYHRCEVEHLHERHASKSIWATILKLPRETKLFFGIYAISLLASSIPALLVLFFIRDLLNAELYTGLFLVLYFLSGAIGMPIWQSLAKRSGKPRAWLVSMVLAVASFIWVYFLSAGDIVHYAIICIMSGIAFGADLALPPSILADHIHASSSQADASSQFSVLAFLAKAALALASVIAFPLLDMAGFAPDEQNSSHALWMLSLIYAAIPCAIKCVAIVMLWRAGPSINLGEYNENYTTFHGSTHHA